MKQYKGGKQKKKGQNRNNSQQPLEGMYVNNYFHDDPYSAQGGYPQQQYQEQMLDPGYHNNMYQQQEQLPNMYHPSMEIQHQQPMMMHNNNIYQGDPGMGLGENEFNENMYEIQQNHLMMQQAFYQPTNEQLNSIVSQQFNPTQSQIMFHPQPQANDPSQQFIQQQPPGSYQQIGSANTQMYYPSHNQGLVNNEMDKLQSNQQFINEINQYVQSNDQPQLIDQQSNIIDQNNFNRKQNQIQQQHQGIQQLKQADKLKIKKAKKVKKIKNKQYTEDGGDVNASMPRRNVIEQLLDEPIPQLPQQDPNAIGLEMQNNFIEHPNLNSLNQRADMQYMNNMNHYNQQQQMAQTHFQMQATNSINEREDNQRMLSEAVGRNQQMLPAQNTFQQFDNQNSPQYQFQTAASFGSQIPQFQQSSLVNNQSQIKEELEFETNAPVGTQTQPQADNNNQQNTQGQNQRPPMPQLMLNQQNNGGIKEEGKVGGTPQSSRRKRIQIRANEEQYRIRIHTESPQRSAQQILDSARQNSGRQMDEKNFREEPNIVQKQDLADIDIGETNLNKDHIAGKQQNNLISKNVNEQQQQNTIQQANNTAAGDAENTKLQISLKHQSSDLLNAVTEDRISPSFNTSPQQITRNLYTDQESLQFNEQQPVPNRSSVLTEQLHVNQQVSGGPFGLGDTRNSENNLEDEDAGSPNNRENNNHDPTNDGSVGGSRYGRTLENQRDSPEPTLKQTPSHTGSSLHTETDYNSNYNPNIQIHFEENKQQNSSQPPNNNPSQGQNLVLTDRNPSVIEQKSNQSHANRLQESNMQSIPHINMDQVNKDNIHEEEKEQQLDTQTYPFTKSKTMMSKGKQRERSKQPSSGETPSQPQKDSPVHKSRDSLVNMSNHHILSINNESKTQANHQNSRQSNQSRCSMNSQNINSGAAKSSQFKQRIQTEQKNNSDNIIDGSIDYQVINSYSPQINIHENPFTQNLEDNPFGHTLKETREKIKPRPKPKKTKSFQVEESETKAFEFKYVQHPSPLNYYDDNMVVSIPAKDGSTQQSQKDQQKDFINVQIKEEAQNSEEEANMIKTPTLKVSGLDEKVMESKEDAHKPFKSSLEEDNNETSSFKSDKKNEDYADTSPEEIRGRKEDQSNIKIDLARVETDNSVKGLGFSFKRSFTTNVQNNDNVFGVDFLGASEETKTGKNKKRKVQSSGGQSRNNSTQSKIVEEVVTPSGNSRRGGFAPTVGQIEAMDSYTSTGQTGPLQQQVITSGDVFNNDKRDAETIQSRDMQNFPQSYNSSPDHQTTQTFSHQVEIIQLQEKHQQLQISLQEELVAPIQQQEPLLELPVLNPTFVQLIRQSKNYALEFEAEPSVNNEESIDYPITCQELSSNMPDNEEKKPAAPEEQDQNNQIAVEEAAIGGGEVVQIDSNFRRAKLASQRTEVRNYRPQLTQEENLVKGFDKQQTQAAEIGGAMSEEKDQSSTQMEQEVKEVAPQEQVAEPQEEKYEPKWIFEDIEEEQILSDKSAQAVLQECNNDKNNNFCFQTEQIKDMIGQEQITKSKKFNNFVAKQNLDLTHQFNRSFLEFKDNFIKNQQENSQGYAEDTDKNGNKEGQQYLKICKPLDAGEWESESKLLQNVQQMDNRIVYVSKAKKLKVRNPHLFEETQYGKSPEPQLPVVRQFTGESLGDLGFGEKPGKVPTVGRLGAPVEHPDATAKAKEARIQKLNFDQVSSRLSADKPRASPRRSKSRHRGAATQPPALGFQPKKLSSQKRRRGSAHHGEQVSELLIETQQNDKNTEIIERQSAPDGEHDAQAEELEPKVLLTGTPREAHSELQGSFQGEASVPPDSTERNKNEKKASVMRLNQNETSQDDGHYQDKECIHGYLDDDCGYVESDEATLSNISGLFEENSGRVMENAFYGIGQLQHYDPSIMQTRREAGESASSNGGDQFNIYDASSPHSSCRSYQKIMILAVKCRILPQQAFVEKESDYLIFLQEKDLHEKKEKEKLVKQTQLVQLQREGQLLQSDDFSNVSQVKSDMQQIMFSKILEITGTTKKSKKYSDDVVEDNHFNIDYLCKHRKHFLRLQLAYQIPLNEIRYNHYQIMLKKQTLNKESYVTDPNSALLTPAANDSLKPYSSKIQVSKKQKQEFKNEVQVFLQAMNIQEQSILNIDELFNSVNNRGANQESKEDKSSSQKHSHQHSAAAKRQSETMILARTHSKETQYLEGYDYMISRILEQRFNTQRFIEIMALSSIRGSDLMIKFKKSYIYYSVFYMVNRLTRQFYQNISKKDLDKCDWYSERLIGNLKSYRDSKLSVYKTGIDDLQYSLTFNKTLTHEVKKIMFPKNDVMSQIRNMIYQNQLCLVRHMTHTPWLELQGLLIDKFLELYLRACKKDDAYKYNMDFDNAMKQYEHSDCSDCESEQSESQHKTEIVNNYLEAMSRAELDEKNNKLALQWLQQFEGNDRNQKTKLTKKEKRQLDKIDLIIKMKKQSAEIIIDEKILMVKYQTDEEKYAEDPQKMKYVGPKFELNKHFGYGQFLIYEGMFNVFQTELYDEAEKRLTKLEEKRLKELCKKESLNQQRIESQKQRQFMGVGLALITLFNDPWNQSCKQDKFKYDFKKDQTQKGTIIAIPKQLNVKRCQGDVNDEEQSDLDLKFTLAKKAETPEPAPGASPLDSFGGLAKNLMKQTPDTHFAALFKSKSPSPPPKLEIGKPLIKTQNPQEEAPVQITTQPTSKDSENSKSGGTAGGKKDAGKKSEIVKNLPIKTTSEIYGDDHEHLDQIREESVEDPEQQMGDGDNEEQYRKLFRNKAYIGPTPMDKNQKKYLAKHGWLDLSRNEALQARIQTPAEETKEKEPATRKLKRITKLIGMSSHLQSYFKNLETDGKKKEPPTRKLKEESQVLKLNPLLHTQIFEVISDGEVEARPKEMRDISQIPANIKREEQKHQDRLDKATSMIEDTKEDIKQEFKMQSLINLSNTLQTQMKNMMISCVREMQQHNLPVTPQKMNKDRKTYLLQKQSSFSPIMEKRFIRNDADKTQFIELQKYDMQILKIVDKQQQQDQSDQESYCNVSEEEYNVNFRQRLGLKIDIIHDQFDADEVYQFSSDNNSEELKLDTPENARSDFEEDDQITDANFEVYIHKKLQAAKKSHSIVAGMPVTPQGPSPKWLNNFSAYDTASGDNIMSVTLKKQQTAQKQQAVRRIKLKKQKPKEDEVANLADTSDNEIKNEQLRQEKKEIEDLKKKFKRGKTVKKLLNQAIGQKKVQFFIDKEKLKKEENDKKEKDRTHLILLSSKVKQSDKDEMKGLAGIKKFQNLGNTIMKGQKGLDVMRVLNKIPIEKARTINRKQELRMQAEFPKLKEAIENNKIQVLNDFVHYNSQFIDIDIENGQTLLGIAVHYGRIKMVELLLKNGANPNEMKALNPTGDTPLHIAVHYKYRKIQDLLIENGADESAPNKKGMTPWEGIA